MLCEACQKNPASVHLTDVSNNQKKEVHLCDGCAQTQGVTVKSYMSKPSAKAKAKVTSTAELLAPSIESASGEGQKCPRCNTTYRQFRASGKFGCPHDYEVFQPKLDDLFEKIHGKNRHAGKVPSRAGDRIAREQELAQLKGELGRAITDEAYERAAELRDRIRRVEERRG